MAVGYVALQGVSRKDAIRPPLSVAEQECATEEIWFQGCEMTRCAHPHTLGHGSDYQQSQRKIKTSGERERQNGEEVRRWGTYSGSDYWAGSQAA